MVFQKFTLENILDEIKSKNIIKEVSLEKDHLMVKGFREYRTLLNEGHQIGWEDPEMVKAFYDYYKGYISTEIIDTMNQLKEAYLFDEYLSCYGKDEDHIEFVRIVPSLNEALLNSIEHGSQFGELDKIQIKIYKGDLGVVVELNDPGEGFSLEKIEERSNKRNNGINYLKDCPVVLVSYQPCSKGFKTILKYKKK